MAGREELYRLFDRLLESITAPPIVELRRRLTPDAALIARPFEWILQPKPWFKGRVLLLGDAAHATSAHMGQGGGMAMEDAVVLGQCIASAATLETALSEFMDRRFDRVRTVVETSVAVSRLEQAGRPASERLTLLRDAFAAIAEPYSNRASPVIPSNRPIEGDDVSNISRRTRNSQRD